MLLVLFSRVINVDGYLVHNSLTINSTHKNALCVSNWKVQHILSSSRDNSFAFNYTRLPGGFAGNVASKYTIAYDPNTNELHSNIIKTNTVRQLSVSEVMNLQEIIQNNSFFTMKQGYAPTNGKPVEMFTYMLSIVLDDNKNTVNWNDLSSIPSGLRYIKNAIEELAINNTK
jgi:hypothetical protein